MKLTKKIRIHSFHEHVAISTPETPQLYISPKNARALAGELLAFAQDCENDEQQLSTRIVENGSATNE